MDNIINKKNEYVLTSAQFQSLVEQKKLIPGSLYFIRDDGFDEEIPTIDLRGDHSFSELSNQNVGVYIILFDNDTANKPAVLGESALIFNIETIGQVKSIITIVNGVLYYSSNGGQTWTTLNTQNLISQSDIIDNLNSDDPTKVLSAKQGKVLDGKITAEKEARETADNQKVNKTTTVNGHALSSNVNITKSDIGLGDVVNTGDSATPTQNGTEKFTTGGAYNLKVDLENKINSLPAIRYRNINNQPINATTSTIQSVATNYIISNYDRQPQDFDGLILTLTDQNNDKVAFMYSEASSLWINIGSNTPDLTGYQEKTDNNLNTTDKTVVGAINELNSGKANDNAVVKLTGDQTINGQKTFVKNLQTQDNLVIVNSNGDTLTDLSGVVVKTGYTGFLFKGNWTLNKYTQSDFGSIEDIQNSLVKITATTNPLKPLVLYSGTTYIVFIDVDQFETFNPVDKTLYYLNHTSGDTTWSITDGVNALLSDVSENTLNTYGIYLQNTAGKIDDTYQVEIFYIKSEFTFSITKWYIGNYYSFITGKYTLNDVEHNFSVYGYQKPSQYFARNFGFNDIIYNFGTDYQDTFSVNYVEGGTRQEAFNVLTKIFTPASSLQTQTVAEAYCIVYDKSSDSVKIGYGYFSGDNFILYENTSESVATREDSSQWINGNLAKWNSVKCQFEDSGKSISDLQEKLTAGANIVIQKDPQTGETVISSSGGGSGVIVAVTGKKVVFTAGATVTNKTLII